MIKKLEEFLECTRTKFLVEDCLMRIVNFIGEWQQV